MALSKQRPSALAAMFALTFAAAAPSLAGCRVAETDIRRWEATERGPSKLVAVVTHDKYSWELRVSAALSLARMPPRGGQRKGIAYLVDKYKDEEGVMREGALTVLSEEARKTIVNGMAPELMKEMQKAPPTRDEKTGRVPPDPTVPYKDIAFAMLSHEPTLVTDQKTKAELVQALIAWSQNGFEERMENGAQQFGVEQMLRFLGSPSVKGLPALISDKAYRVDRIAGLVADLGDDDTKKRASEALVTLAKKILSKEWVDEQTKIVKEHNAKGSTKATDEQVGVQVQKIQDRRLNEEIFPAMKKVGGRPAVEFLLGFAGEPKNGEDRRKTALAALEGRVDKNSTQDLDRVFAVAKDDASTDAIRDVAFQRLGEFPKEQLTPRLYQLFEAKKWKVRWVAASLLLKTITPKQLPEFLRKLPATNTTKMGMTEGLSYGGIIAKMEVPSGEPKPHDLLLPYLTGKDFGAKMVAIGFFYEGKKADQAALKPVEEDKTAVPKCEKEDDCQWHCDVPKTPGGKETELKEVATVSDLVRLCVLPTMTK